MNLPELQGLLSRIRYKTCVFVCGNVRDTSISNGDVSVLGIAGRDALWFQVQYPVIDKGIHRMAKGRRWIVETDNSSWQVVATAFKACLTVEEHESRESFLYNGAAVFFPHHDLDELVAMRRGHAAVAGTSEAEDKI